MASLKLKISRGIETFSFFDWLFAVCLILLSFFSFYKLGSMIFNNDAHFWYERTFNFVDAIKKFDFAGTYQNPKPGVTVMWLAGISSEAFLTLYNLIYRFRPNLYTYDTFRYIHFAARFPLVLLNIGFVAYFFISIKRLLNERIALFSSALLMFQPFFIATSRIFHADSTLTVFMGLSVLLLIEYFVNPRVHKKLHLSGIFGGLALLTKLSAIFLIPYLGLIALIYVLVKKEGIKSYLKTISIWFSTSFITFFALFPAMWVKPIETLSKLYVEIFSLTNTGRDGISPFSHYFKILPDFITPWLLMLTFAGFILILIRGYKKENTGKSLVLLSAVLFCVFYLLQMSLATQKMPRYLVPLFPFFSILGAYALDYFLNLFELKHEKALVVVFVFLTLIPVVSYFPHYSFYVNEPGRDSFDCSLCSDVGSYINDLEEGPEFTVLIDSINSQRFRPFIKGTTVSPDERNNFESITYVVRDTRRMESEYENCDHIKSFDFKKIDYWHVLKCDGY